MKYVLLIYQGAHYDPKALGADEHRAVAAAYAEVGKTAGVRPGLPLGLASDAITVQVRDGETATTKGPYVQTHGAAVGGYFEFEAEDDAAAVALAAKIPAAAQGGAIEIRPSRTYW